MQKPYYNIVVKSKTSKIVTYGVLLIFVILWYFISKYLFTKLSTYLSSQHSIIKNWWNSSGGSKYNHLFDINMLTEYNNQQWIVSIDRLFTTSKVDQLSSYDSIQFIIQYIIPNIFIKSTSGQLNLSHPYNFVYPRHMCNSILFQTGEDYYYDNGVKTGVSDKTYPSVTDTTTWIALISKWCGGATNGAFAPPAGTSEVLQIFIPKSGIDTKVISKDWFDYNSYPDNIFARYGMSYDSPFIVSLCNRKLTSYNGVPLHFSAVTRLLGSSETGQTILAGAGGWVGFLEFLNNENMKPEDFLYTAMDLGRGIIAKGDNKSKCSAGEHVTKILTGAGTGAGIGAMGGMMAATAAVGTAAGPVGWLLLLVGAAIGVAGGIEGNNKCK